MTDKNRYHAVHQNEGQFQSLMQPKSNVCYTVTKWNVTQQHRWSWFATCFPLWSDEYCTCTVITNSVTISNIDISAMCCLYSWAKYNSFIPMRWLQAAVEIIFQHPSLISDQIHSGIKYTARQYCCVCTCACKHARVPSFLSVFM